jgi:hypothetical protein
MKKGRLLILVFLILSVLLSSSIIVSARVYSIEDECIIFIKTDKLIYFSILEEKIIGGYTAETDVSKIIAINIKQGVEYMYDDGGKEETQTKTRIQIVIKNIDTGVKTRIMPFGKNKTGIGIFFTFSASVNPKKGS